MMLSVMGAPPVEPAGGKSREETWLESVVTPGQQRWAVGKPYWISGGWHL